MPKDLTIDPRLPQLCYPERSEGSAVASPESARPNKSDWQFSADATSAAAVMPNAHKEMNLNVGPVPPWSAPLWKKLMFLALGFAIVSAATAFRSMARVKTREWIIFAAVALALLGLTAAFHTS